MYPIGANFVISPRRVLVPSNAINSHLQERASEASDACDLRRWGFTLVHRCRTISRVSHTSGSTPSEQHCHRGPREGRAHLPKGEVRPTAMGRRTAPLTIRPDVERGLGLNWAQTNATDRALLTLGQQEQTLCNVEGELLSRRPAST